VDELAAVTPMMVQRERREKSFIVFKMIIYAA
jgi:hypothetical protein